jgi:hypothetical protein
MDKPKLEEYEEEYCEISGKRIDDEYGTCHCNNNDRTHDDCKYITYKFFRNDQLRKRLQYLAGKIIEIDYNSLNTTGKRTKTLKAIKDAFEEILN